MATVNEKMTAIADAIRSKTGKTDALTLDQMAFEVNSLEIGIELPELTNEGTASDLLSGKQLIDGDGNVVTGTIPTQAAKTITPSTSSQTAVASGRYTTGAVTVAPIPGKYEDVATETAEYTSLNNELEDVINSLPNADGSSGSVETCTVIITKTNSLPCTWAVFYNSLENNSIIGKSESLTSTAATITAIQGSVVVFIEAVNIGSSMDPDLGYGMENCSVSNEGIVLQSILDTVECKICAIAIQLPKTSTCTITFS